VLSIYRHISLSKYSHKTHNTGQIGYMFRRKYAIVRPITNELERNIKTDSCTTQWYNYECIRKTFMWSLDNKI